MRILKKLFIFILSASFCIMILSQILLKNDDIKVNLSRLYKYESRYVYSEKEISEGFVNLQISNPSETLFLLQNGEKIAALNSEQIQVEISDNSVIEVDGRNSGTVSTVKITDLSDNIDGFYENIVKINSNIVVLGLFFVK